MWVERSGKPTALMNKTLKIARGLLARLCVEVDLSKPLKRVLLLNGKRLKLEYENLHIICYDYGKYDHLFDKCSSRRIEASSSAGRQDKVDDV